MFTPTGNVLNNLNVSVLMLKEVENPCEDIVLFMYVAISTGNISDNGNNLFNNPTVLFVYAPA